jgi:subtilisin family serine protease
VSVWAKALGVGIVWLCNVGCADAENAVSGQLVVGFSAGTTAQRGEAIVARAGGAIRRHLGAIRAAAVRPRPGRTTADLRAALRGHRAIRSVNCSCGASSKSSALQDAVEYAKEKGVLLVVAAGNDGDSLESHPEYPASYTDGNIVTGAAAMLRAKDPGLTYAQLRSTLLASVDKLPSLQGRIVTGGRLDLDRAMERTP